MTITISARNHGQMRERRKAVADCYICGTPLRRDGPDGRPLKLSDEHVIPKRLLNRIPVADADRVPLILDVHKPCEDGHKVPNEQLTILLLRFFALDDRIFHNRDVGTLRAHTHAQSREERDGFAPSQLVVPAGTETLLHIWARGLIAALHGKSLPPNVGQHSSLPVPFLKEAGAPGNGIKDVQHWSELRDVIVSTVVLAKEGSGVDQLSFWGERVRFSAAWRHLPGCDPKLPWVCCWTLELPGYEQWSQAVLGYPNPWHGMVCTDTLPESASVLTEADAERLKKVHQKRREAGFE